MALYDIVQFGDLSLPVRKRDGYINASKLCQAGGRLMGDWNALKSTKLVIQETCAELGKTKDELMQIVFVGTNQLFSGTYVHPRLVVHIASWISPRFAVKVSSFVEQWRAACVENELEYRRQVSNCVIYHPAETEQEEKKWQIYLAERENGEVEVPAGDGRADVVSARKIIEIKKADSWKHALGQVQVYARDFKDREKWIALFGNADSKDYIRDVCRDFGVYVEFLEQQSARAI